MDGDQVDLSMPPDLNRYENHDISVVVDRLALSSDDSERFNRIGFDRLWFSGWCGSSDRASREKSSGAFFLVRIIRAFNVGLVSQK